MIVSLESDQAIITPGSTVLVTVTVRAEAALPTDKATLTVTLPKGMVTSDGTKNQVQWPLPTLAAQEELVQQLQFTIDKINENKNFDFSFLFVRCFIRSFLPYGRATLSRHSMANLAELR